MTHWRLPAHGGRRYCDPTKVPTDDLPDLPVAPSVSAARLNDTTIRFSFTGGSDATSWAGFYRTPAGSGSYTEVSLTVDQDYYDVTVISEGTANFYVDADNADGSDTSNIATGSAAADDEALFSDDFSSGDLSTYNDHFRWGSGNIPTAGQSAGSIVSVTGPLGTPVNAIRLRFAPRDGGESDDAKYQREERFHLTSSASEVRPDPDSPSSVNLMEVYVQYDVFIPANYEHTLGGFGGNNKGWVNFWKNAYGAGGGSGGGAAIDWWLNAEHPGDSQQGAWASGHVSNFNNHPDDGGVPYAYRDPDGSYTSVWDEEKMYPFPPSKYGQWIRVTVGTKIADSGVDNGWIRIWHDGELYSSWENLHNRVATNPGIDRGYLFGWQNSGYEEETIFYIAGFKFGVTAAQMGVS